MAPGPLVRIVKKEGIEFDSERFVDEESDEEDDIYGSSNYTYYESDKILGKLYRAIDERKIYEEITKPAEKQQTNTTDSVIHQLWAHAQQKCQLFQWKQYRSDAEEIMHE